METRQWHYVIEGNQAGPVPEPELVDMLSAGQLPPETLVWTETQEDWVEASTVDDLVHPAPAVAPVAAVTPEVVNLPTPEPVREEVATVTYAGFWKRFAASLIDGIIVSMVGVFFGAFSGVLFGRILGSPEGAALIVNGVSIVTQWLYYALLESSPNQATVGKMALGVKVTDMDGNRISFARATGRHFGKILSALLFCIGYLMVAFTPRKQGLHDIMAGCLVVNR